MKLDDYISETLVAIVQGVKKAQTDCKDTNARISPYNYNPSIAEARERSFGRSTDVEFDVALTVESGTQTKGGIGVVSGIVNLGSAGQSANSQVVVNRIKFVVPVELPYVNPAKPQAQAKEKPV
jgi:hypothetical protein